MKTNPIPSLGDATRQKVRLINEERLLPSTREAIVAEFRNILGLGGVQRIVVELGRPIRLSRLVKDDDMGPTDTIEWQDLLSGIRNAEVRELMQHPSWDMHEYLFNAFALLSQGRLKAHAFCVSNLSLLRKALRVDEMWDLSTLYGVNGFIFAENDVPEDVMLLAATRQDSEDIALTLRLTLAAPRVETKK